MVPFADPSDSESLPVCQQRGTTTMVDRRTRATEQVLAHVDKARDMIHEFRKDCISGDGALKNPRLRNAALRAACDELKKARKLIHRTRWSR